MSALNHLGVSAEILKLGVTHPLPKSSGHQFSPVHSEVHVLEELDPILENEIKALCYDQGIKTKIIGKSGLSDELDLKIGEYDPTRLVNVLAGRLGIETALNYSESSISCPCPVAATMPGMWSQDSFLRHEEGIRKRQGSFFDG